jgi:NAD-dependent dihydropyrimidine dehydrogenase PreA subunit
VARFRVVVYARGVAMGFSYTVVADVCEGVGDCIPICPTECIHWADEPNARGEKHVFIDAGKCIDCAACLSVCPTEGAILDEWKPDLQRPNSVAQTYSTFDPAWRTMNVVAHARVLFETGSADVLLSLAGALEEAGCTDERLLAYCRQGKHCSGGRWVAELILG